MTQGLLDSAKGGDAAALSHLLARVDDRLLRIARARLTAAVRLRVDDEDLRQEIAIRVVQVHGRDPKALAAKGIDTVARFLAYADRIAERIVIDFYRRAMRAKRGGPGGRRAPAADVERPGGSAVDAARTPSPVASPLTGASRREETERMLAAMDGLPLRHRVVLRTRLIEEIPAEEVARRWCRFMHRAAAVEAIAAWVQDDGHGLATIAGDPDVGTPRLARWIRRVYGAAEVAQALEGARGRQAAQTPPLRALSKENVHVRLHRAKEALRKAMARPQTGDGAAARVEAKRPHGR